ERADRLQRDLRRNAQDVEALRATRRDAARESRSGEDAQSEQCPVVAGDGRLNWKDDYREERPLTSPGAVRHQLALAVSDLNRRRIVRSVALRNAAVVHGDFNRPAANLDVSDGFPVRRIADATRQ